MEGLVAELVDGARAEMAIVAEQGGAVAAVDHMKAALVDSHRERVQRIESGEHVVVGVNRYVESEPSPLQAGADGGILTVDPAVEAEERARSSAGAPSATRAPSRRPWPSWRGSRAASRTSCPPRSRRPAPARRPASGRPRCATRSASSARRPASARRSVRAGRDARGAARGGRARQRRARAAAEGPRRQAGPRRALQRRRADRRARARQRHGRRLRGHPPDPVADRVERAPGGRARRRAVDPRRARTAS